MYTVINCSPIDFDGILGKHLIIFTIQVDVLLERG